MQAVYLKLDDYLSRLDLLDPELVADIRKIDSSDAVLNLPFVTGMDLILEHGTEDTYRVYDNGMTVSFMGRRDLTFDKRSRLWRDGEQWSDGSKIKILYALKALEYYLRQNSLTAFLSHDATMSMPGLPTDKKKPTAKSKALNVDFDIPYLDETTAVGKAPPSIIYLDRPPTEAPGIGKGLPLKFGHRRRRHRRTLRADRYRGHPMYMVPRAIPVKESWVGPKEYLVRDRIYRYIGIK